MNKLISIVMPFYNMWHLTHARLLELYKYAPDNCEIVLVNDASTDIDCRYGSAWWQKRASRHTIRYIINKKNKGFLKSMNKGVKVAKGDIIILLSNDVIISGDFITDIVNKLEEYPKSLVGNSVLLHDTGWNVFDGKIFIYAEGYLLACTKEAWKDLGGFDKRFAPNDYEDVDLSTTALDKGYILVTLNSLYLKHIHGATIYKVYGVEARKKQTEINRLKFYKKWCKDKDEKRNN